MFQLNKGGLGAPVTPVPKFDATPFPELFTPIVNKVTPVDFTDSVQNVTPIDMNTIKGVSGKVYTSDKQLPLPPISSGSTPTIDTVVRSASRSSMPSHIPGDNYGMKGVMDRDWNDFSDVQFYVGNDGRYYSTDPFFDKLLKRESTNRLNAVNGNFRGPAQMGKAAWSDAMPGIPYEYATNPDYAGKAAVNYAKWHIGQLKRAGVPIDALSVYAAHNLGIGNAIELFRDLDAPLTGSLRKAIMSNINDSKHYLPTLYEKLLRDTNLVTRRDYIDLLRNIFSY